MEIRSLSLLSGAHDVNGIAVIIDVFRAFTCVPLMLSLGVKEVILEKDVQKARLLKNRFEGALLVGEEDEVPIQGCDIGNSPYELLMLNDQLKGKTVIHRTTAGVNGVWAAIEKAERVFVTSFINARATAMGIKLLSPRVVSIVAMGERGLHPSLEDEACACYIKSMLSENTTFDYMNFLSRIIHLYSFKKFFDMSRPYLHPEDPLICLQRDLLDLLVQAELLGDIIVARAVH